MAFEVPLLVGGAALSEKFATTRIGPAYGSPTFYAKDAMTGLGIMNQLMDPAEREAALASHLFTTAPAPAPEPAPSASPVTERSPKSASISRCRRARISTAACAKLPACK
jgi:5-methyltetrahydrofolate--homocysteine methyltransferase